MRSMSTLSPVFLLALAGSASGQAFPAVVELSSLDGTTGFVINGIDRYDYSGFAVSSAGDFNGDGLGDLIIGAYGADPNGNAVAGETYIVFGRSTGFGASLDLSSLDGTNGFVLNGIDPVDVSGFAVSSAGDFNGDGFDDIMIGAKRADPNGITDAGECSVVFGHAGSFASSFELSSLDGANGFVFQGADMTDNSGYSVSCAGDVNGDGFDDVILGAPEVDQYPGQLSAGECYVIFGAAGGFAASMNPSSLNGANGFVLQGTFAGDVVGRSVSAAGDVNGDGIGDLIMGAPGADPGGVSAAGQSFVVFGGANNFSALLPLMSLDGSNGFVVNGIDAGDSSGRSVADAGDVNGDGFDDFIIGADFAAPNGVARAGESSVLFGGPNVGAIGSIGLASLNGTNGFVINGIGLHDYSGKSVSAAGDVNGDGIGDLIIGAHQASPNGINRAGESYVVFGGSGLGASGSLELSSLDGTNGFVIHGIDAFDYSGISVSSAGDVNGDGIDDLVIGAWNATPNFVNGRGQSYVVFGRSDTTPCVPDVNGDGMLTPADFTAWIAAFNAMAPGCDQNGDGNCDPTDFTAWIANFNTGCP